MEDVLGTMTTVARWGAPVAGLLITLVAWTLFRSPGILLAVGGHAAMLISPLAQGIFGRFLEPGERFTIDDLGLIYTAVGFVSHIGTVAIVLAMLRLITSAEAAAPNERAAKRVAAVFVLIFIPQIAGIAIARRAWKRHGWPEMKLAFHAFVAGIAIAVIAFIAALLVGWPFDDDDPIILIRLISAVQFTTYAITSVAIAVALYRLAGRSARREHRRDQSFAFDPVARKLAGGPLRHDQ